MNRRDELIKMTLDNHPDGPFCARVIRSHDTDLLVSCGSRSDEPYDAYVFTENFSGDKLVAWQEQMIDDSPYPLVLGQQSPSSLKYTWLVSYGEQPLSPEHIDSIRAYFGCGWY